MRAYGCEWYNEPVPFQKSIGMMVMRAQKPVYIYMGAFGTMSLELLAAVSIINLLHSVMLMQLA